VPNPVRLISEPELYERIQQTYSYSFAEREQKESEQDIMNQLCRAPLLIIDDMGKTPRRDMDFVRRTMFNIINRRYKALLPVVITTNKDLEGLRDYLGNSSDEATLDRIMEMAEGSFCKSLERLIGEVSNGGKSRRMSKVYHGSLQISYDEQPEKSAVGPITETKLSVSKPVLPLSTNLSLAQCVFDSK